MVYIIIYSKIYRYFIYFYVLRDTILNVIFANYIYIYWEKYTKHLFKYIY